jgi:hypothetical protein
VPAIASFQSVDGTHVLVDVSDGRSDDVARRGLNPTEAIERAAGNFDELVAGLQTPINAMLATFRSAAEGVDEVQLRFGVRFRADAGAIISRIGGDVNFEVVVYWRRPPADGGVPQRAEATVGDGD